MIINCKKCNKNFEVDDNLISLEGTLVQCGSCQYKWHQKKEVASQNVEDHKLIKDISITDNKVSNNPNINLEKKNTESPSKKVSSRTNDEKKKRLKEIEDIKLEIIREKETLDPKKTKKDTKKKIKKIGYISSILIFLISIIALYIILDTFQYQIGKYWQNFDKYFYYINETVFNIFILIKDLIKSYS